MKIAILYSGIIGNNISDIYENHHQYILSQYPSTEVYCSTYNNYSDEDNKNIDMFRKLFDPQKLDIENWQNIKSNLQNLEKIISNCANETVAINTLSMFYKIFKCYQLIQKNNYDIVIRSRTDIKFDRYLLLENNSSLNVPSGGDHRGGLLDLFAYGNQIVIKKYCSLFDNIENYINDINILFHPESLLRYHCNKNSIKINRFIYNIYLRNMNFTQTAPCVY